MKSAQARILVLEDDSDLRDLLSNYYTPRGYALTCYEDPTVPLRELETLSARELPYDLVLTDLKMPNMDGIAFIERMKKVHPELPIILMTTHGSVENAVSAVESGAFDFIVKPLHFPQLNVVMERALKMRRLQIDNAQLRSAVRSTWSFEGVVGKSTRIQAVFDLAKRVANSNANVLITGESGTGKEVIARAIHQHGSRRKGPFVAINCSAIPETLLESELFGHAKGSFTGASEKKVGLFEEAEGGVLFLDEIGDLNLPLQAKLLRVLQERKVKRIGENQYRPIDVRILCATHKSLRTEVQEKRFREDLFFRLNVIPIEIPPLRERPEDIIPLAQHFFKRFSAENETRAQSISTAALDLMLRLPWRGNVRELENAIERAVVLANGPEILPEDLPRPELTPSSPRPAAASSTEELFGQLTSVPTENLPSLEEFDLRYIQHVLKSARGVKEQAARILKIDRKTLYRRVAEIQAMNGSAC